MKYRILSLIAVGALVGACQKSEVKPKPEASGDAAPVPSAPAASPATPSANPAAPAAGGVATQLPGFVSPYMEKLLPHLKHADGTAVASGEVSSAKQTLLYFSASWCGPCKQFTPQLIAQYKALQDAGIQVVLANRDANTEKMLAYMSSHSQPWPGLPPEVQNDKTFDLSAFTDRGIPSLALLDADGKLIKKGIAWTLLPELLKDLPPAK